MTVRHALGRLVAHGLLVRRRGIGTFVAKPKMERVTSHLLGFEEDMVAHGLTPQTKLLEQGWLAPDGKDAQMLELTSEERVLQVKRLRYTNNEPIGINTIQLVPSMGRQLENEDFTRSFYTLVNETLGSGVAFAKQRVEAVPAEREQAQLLNVEKGMCFLKVERLTYLQDNRLLGLTRSYYRGDCYFLSLTVER